ncbi:DNA topoisomerase IB [Arthrobacter roseus]|uniref:DNA topoisomerase IB n=1 Tax=Arthrobacter roseus TaxID=136274 RepID=UPI00196602DC|nr:DNA topoisomerase IB [Arthrobacter roseus]MBM7847271.1 DNA topoisomerase-1 [Arthrobacter roseus]
MPRLRRSAVDKPGIRRRRRGKGFSYTDENGNTVRDPETLQRLRDLVVPPAWTDVWLATHANDHIQALGTDAAGRRQYMYHQKWRETKDREKFDRALEFASTLPSARRTITRHLRADEITRERAFAAALRIVDSGALRVGSAQYAQANGSFGVTTLLGKHVKLRGNSIGFDFPGKSGQRWHITLEDEDLARALKPMLRRNAEERVLSYKDDDGAWHSVDGNQLNEFLRQVTGGDFTAKDFRTWQATVSAAMELARADAGASSDTARRKAVTDMMKTVAEHLGNTPAVVRSSYVDPRLVEMFMRGEAIQTCGISTSERAVQDLLNG